MSGPTAIQNRNPVSFLWDTHFGDGEMEPWSKRPKYFYRLESETSHTSDEETESIRSLQEKETDTVRDTSDTDTRTESDLEVEIEYELASDIDEECALISSSSEEEMVMAATAAAYSTSNNIDGVELFITDCEDSDTSSQEEPTFKRKDFSTCIRCRGTNDNPLYRYCEKCFQDRKTFFPPRPRRRRSRPNKKSPIKSRPNRKKSPIKLSAVKSCLNALSQDSGLGSSQECPVLNLDKIVVGNQAKGTEVSSQSTVTSSQDIIASSQSTVASSHDTILSSQEVIACSHDIIPSSQDTMASVLTKDASQPSVSGLSTISRSNITSSASGSISLSRKRVFSESSLSDSDVGEQPKYKQLKVQSEGSLMQNSPASDTLSSQNSVVGEASSSLGSISMQRVNRSSDQSSELCIVCNTAPKNGIFLHGTIAHMCCCYYCAIRTWKQLKRCPICNRRINNVVKLYT